MTKITLKYIILNFLKNALDWYGRQIELPSSDLPAVDGGVKFKTIALSKTKDNIKITYLPAVDGGVKLKTIALSKTNDKIKITYKSAIALQLARQSGPTEIAEKLVQFCLHQGVADCSTNTPQISQKPGFFKKPGFLSDPLAAHLEVKVVPPGLLLFELTDSGIAAWLEYFLEELPLSVVEEDLPFLVAEDLFKIQYSHARCCSLLRMGDRLLPDAISWQETDSGLRLNHPAERRLISQIFSTWDLLYFPTATPQEINWQKVATALSEAFQNFYGQCRILGEVKIDNPELAKARLGLILIAKYLLQFLLEEKLKVKAPTEL